MDLINLAQEQSEQLLRQYLARFSKENLTQEQIFDKLRMMLSIQFLITTNPKSIQEKTYDMLVLASMVDAITDYVNDVTKDPQFDTHTYFETQGKKIYKSQWNNKKRRTLYVIDLIVSPKIKEAIYDFGK
jgi:hypothetical protein